ncbi:MAG: 16S rRNA (cytidine(1402)-2'-O)-methyltransferase [Alphaproteobacteria bacterium]|nr:16S rRNA (cytidine(1402)-2'-O)-methyltransferase [Alphaproteobacteria bacterium]MCB9699679.1 16S rRNA (cytidine(1402)-2'-O)-methyltransferase [Alphaproteobacteria bacterium]
MRGTLFIVPTPIGQPSDLSPRGVEVLSRVAVIAAEDTRVIAALLRELGLPSRPAVSTHDHNEAERAAGLVARMLAGEDVALVSDAGTPLVSDPGYRVVVAAIDAGVPVVVLPGPCAAITGLVGSGLPPDRFLFLGFLPRDEGPRAAALEARRFEPATVVLYEAPHRVVELLDTVRRVLGGGRRVVVARSLTKVWEEWIRGTADEVAERFRAEDPVRGELTVVIEGFRGDAGEAEAERLDSVIRGLAEAGVSPGVIRDVLADVYDRPRREIYQRALGYRNR